jgi:hypothetical protein
MTSRLIVAGMLFEPVAGVGMHADDKRLAKLQQFKRERDLQPEELHEMEQLQARIFEEFAGNESQGFHKLPTLDTDVKHTVGNGIDEI